MFVENVLKFKIFSNQLLFVLKSALKVAQVASLFAQLLSSEIRFFLVALHFNIIQILSNDVSTDAVLK